MPARKASRQKFSVLTQIPGLDAPQRKALRKVTRTAKPSLIKVVGALQSSNVPPEKWVEVAREISKRVSNPDLKAQFGRIADALGRGVIDPQGRIRLDRLISVQQAFTRGGHGRRPGREEE